MCLSVCVPVCGSVCLSVCLSRTRPGRDLPPSAVAEAVSGEGEMDVNSRRAMDAKTGARGL